LVTELDEFERERKTDAGGSSGDEDCATGESHEIPLNELCSGAGAVCSTIAIKSGSRYPVAAGASALRSLGATRMPRVCTRLPMKHAVLLVPFAGGFTCMTGHKVKFIGGWPFFMLQLIGQLATN
jgi:hypothetical protein